MQGLSALRSRYSIGADLQDGWRGGRKKTESRCRSAVQSLTQGNRVNKREIILDIVGIVITALVGLLAIILIGLV